MRESFLKNLEKGRDNVSVHIKVLRKWTVREKMGQGDPLYIGLVVADTKGDVMYAEMADEAMQKKSEAFQIGGTYIISKFLVSYCRPTYKPFEARLMINITEFTSVAEMNLPNRNFPAYAYHITQFSRLNPTDGVVATYTDVLGYLTKYTAVQSFQPKGKETISILREVYIKNLSDEELKITLWGDLATNFNINHLYSEENPRLVVGLFVGCLPRRMYNDRNKTYLSGSSACSYYFNPNIKEAEPYHNRFKDQPMYIERPPPTEETGLEEKSVVIFEHKTIAELNAITDPYELVEKNYKCTVTVTAVPDNNNWWYMSCDPCKKRIGVLPGGGYYCSICKGSNNKARYLLTFMAADDSAEATFFAHDDVAKLIVLKECDALFNPLTQGTGLPLQLQAIVSKKFTFTVGLTDDSFTSTKRRKYLVQSILDRSDRKRSALNNEAPNVLQNIGSPSKTSQAQEQLTYLGTDSTPPPLAVGYGTCSKDTPTRATNIAPKVRRSLLTDTDMDLEESQQEQASTEDEASQDDDEVTCTETSARKKRKRSGTGSKKTVKKGGKHTASE